MHAALMALLSLSLAACDSSEMNNPDATINLRVDVSGLDGTVRLYNAGVGSFAVTGSGSVTVGTHLLSGSGYAITVAQHPVGQTCVVTDGTGVAGATPTPVQVACAASQIPVAVAVSGLSGGELLLSNGDETLAVTADGTHAFPTLATWGDTYDVILDTEPVGHACTLTDGSGTATDPAIHVAVSCVAVDPLMIRKVTLTSPAPKFLTVNWQSVPGATHYKLMRDNDGVPGGARTQVGTNTTATSLTDRVAVHLRTSYLYTVDACDALRCVESVPASASDASLRAAIGYFKPDQVIGWMRFGARVALSSDGQTLAVGTRMNGTYVFVRPTGAAYWKQQARLPAYPAVDGSLGINLFGDAVALSADGRTLAVGNEDNTTRVYFRSGGTWSLQGTFPMWRTNDVAAALAVGLSADGNTLALKDTQAFRVYQRTGSTWGTFQKIPCGSLPPNGYGFALAVSGDGNTIAVGAGGDSTQGTGINPAVISTDYRYDIGAVFLFVRSGDSWVQQTWFKPAYDTSGTAFGASVSLSHDGNTLAVGAAGDRSKKSGIFATTPYSVTTDYYGSTYLYTRSGSTWSQQAYIKPYVAGPNDWFGSAVSLSADGRTLAVGAQAEDSALADLTPGASLDNTAPDAGAAYVFSLSGTTWKQSRFIKSSLPAAGDGFGGSLALSADGQTLAVGAAGEQDLALGINGVRGVLSSPTEAPGAVYVY